MQLLILPRFTFYAYFFSVVTILLHTGCFCSFGKHTALTMKNSILVNKLQQACQFHQVATSLLKLELLQLVICTLVTTC